MKFKDIINIALYKVGEDVTEPDNDGLQVIKNAINQAYMLVRSISDKRTATDTLPYQKAIQLPEGVDEIINLSHDEYGDLSPFEYSKIADVLYITSPIKDGNIQITYVKLPERLVDETDIVDISDKYANALGTYGAYAYRLYKRKYPAAQLLLSEFNQIIQPQQQGGVE